MMTSSRSILFWFLFLSVVFQCSSRPRKFYLIKNGNYLRRFLKSVTSQRTELFCPRNIEGRNFITKQTEKKVACGEEYDLCQDNNDCEPGLLCCPSACIYKCVLPQKPKSAIATDWVDEPESLTVGGNPWLIPGEGSNPSPIDCSTSVFPGIEPTNCPTGFTCIIKNDGDAAKQIPNRGICAKKASSNSNEIEDLLNTLNTKPESSCFLHGKEVPHGYHEQVDCNYCFCKDGEMYCQMNPCPSKQKI